MVVLYGALVNKAADPVTLVNVLDEVGFLNRGLQELAAKRRVTRTIAIAKGALGSAPLARTAN